MAFAIEYRRTVISTSSLTLAEVFSSNDVCMTCAIRTKTPPRRYAVPIRTYRRVAGCSQMRSPQTHPFFSAQYHRNHLQFALSNAASELRLRPCPFRAQPSIKIGLFHRSPLRPPHLRPHL